MARQLISGCLQQLNDMAGPMISGVLGQLGSAAFEMAEDEVKAVKDVEKQIEKLSSELTAIQAVLEDAEKRQFKEVTVRDWLDKLKDVSHDIDDVLDEWITAIRKANTAKEVKADEDPSPSKKADSSTRLPPKDTSAAFTHSTLPNPHRTLPKRSGRGLAQDISHPKHPNLKLVVGTKTCREYLTEYLQRKRLTYVSWKACWLKPESLNWLGFPCGGRLELQLSK